eukprot:TRINITY_DN51031_c0_g1_i1.p1 TRINITY_DN51031_c0_g1~~TRINITY_DN51031_c0_g1_i1.p1  ORF type:complete len:325 (+),score=67.01 TRINITY_DN51031_c0_g1_i1:67-975(+)
MPRRTLQVAAPGGLLGIRWTPQDNAPILVTGTSGAAAAAGLKAGEVIVAFDGTPTPRVDTYLAALHAWQQKAITTVTLESAPAPRSVVLPRYLLGGEALREVNPLIDYPWKEADTLWDLGDGEATDAEKRQRWPWAFAGFSNSLLREMQRNRAGAPPRRKHSAPPPPRHGRRNPLSALLDAPARPGDAAAHAARRVSLSRRRRARSLGAPPPPAAAPRRRSASILPLPPRVPLPPPLTPPVPPLAPLPEAPAGPPPGRSVSAPALPAVPQVGPEARRWSPPRRRRSIRRGSAAQERTLRLAA